MPNLKEVRTRIQSTISTQQITSAMKMVSAAKLRRAQDAILRMRPYASKLRGIMENVTASLGGSGGTPLSEKRDPKNILAVVITSNRGLCGAFNASVIRLAVHTISETYPEQKRTGSVQILAIGKKGADFFRKNNYLLYANRSALFDNLTYQHVSALADEVLMAFANKKFDRVEIFYNRFKNVASQILTREPYLPVETSPRDDRRQTTNNYIYEPEMETLLGELLPKALRIQLFKALLDSHAAEHGARMTAMHKATDNAQELLRELRLSYNKVRQAVITKEILEIVGGAEALKN